MADLNEVRLIGRLTRDPELKATPTGHYVCHFGLATGRKFKGQDGVFREETTFVDITCWGKVAENVAKYMKKGRLIFVGGRLKFDSWDDKQTGQKRSKLSVVAETIQFLDRRDDQMGGMAPMQGMADDNMSQPSQWATPPLPGQPQGAPAWTPPASPTAGANVNPGAANSNTPPPWDEPTDLGEPPF